MHYQKIYNLPLGQMTLINDGQYLTDLIFANLKKKILLKIYLYLMKKLTGYGSGIDNKIKLLEIEKIDIEEE